MKVGLPKRKLSSWPFYHHFSGAMLPSWRVGLSSRFTRKLPHTPGFQTFWLQLKVAGDMLHLSLSTRSLILDILPETNIAPENRPLEKEIPIGNHHV